MGTVVARVAERRELGGVTDSELVRAARSGDDRAFERLYQRYHRRIAAYVLGMVNDYGRAEDITQEVFISALRRMRQTERSIAFKPWIYEIAKNACIDQFRRGRRTEEVSFDAGDGQGTLLADGVRFGTDGGADEIVTARQDLDHLRGAFGGLSQSHHRILVLRELEGRSYREIGERMGLSRPSVESTLFRARRRLGEEYQELSSGERCASIQSLIEVSSSALGVRDQRRLDAHIAHCRPCRREARLVAVGLRSAGGDRHGGPLAAKVAGVLPLPLVWRRGGEAGAGAAAPGGGFNLPGSLSGMAEPLAGWAKALVAATVVAAGAGAGAASVAGVDEPPGSPARAGQAPNAPAAERAELQRPSRARRLDPTAGDAGTVPASTAPAASVPAGRWPAGGGAGGPAREEVAPPAAGGGDPALPPVPAPVIPLEPVEARPQTPSLERGVEADVAAPPSVPGIEAEAPRVAGPIKPVDASAALPDEISGALPTGG